MHFKINKRELMSAGLLLAIGLASAIGGSRYTVGSLDRMGPGFFPTALGVLLIFLSLLMVLTPVAQEDENAPERQAPQYRAWACVTAGVTAFIVLGLYGGLVPGTFALVMISALGDKGNSLKSAAALGAGVTVLAVLLFRMLLQLQIPLFTWM